MATRFTLSLMAFLYLAKTFGNEKSHPRTKIFEINYDPRSRNNSKRWTLETIAAQVEEQTSVQIDIKIPRLQLNANVSFTNLNSLTISGEPGLTTITCTAGGNSSAGIVLSDINGTITLNKLNLTSCGSVINTKFYADHGKIYSSALTIFRCRCVELKELVIARSRGTGLIILDHQGGSVNIKSTIFSDNRLAEEFVTRSVLGGGGAYILQESQYSYQMTFLFDRCKFQHNIAHTKYYKFMYTSILGERRNGYGRGGGAYIMLKSGVKSINVSFIGCEFIANQAFIGGGLSINIHGKSPKETKNVVVEIKNSTFINNGCSDSENTTGFGGGLHLTFNTFLARSGIEKSQYLIKDVTFTQNCAELGGGVLYFSDRGKLESMSTNSMLFHTCSFKKNEAHIGSAVAMTPNLFLKLSSGYIVLPVFQDCEFIQNSAVIKQTQSYGCQYKEGVGTVYASYYDIHFQGYNVFQNNWGSSIYTVNGVVNFTKSSASFISNTGLQGGAIALIGSSTMIVGPNNYEFIDNTALYQGGAVFVLLMDNTDFTISKSCFIQYVDNNSAFLSSEWKSNITFIGNKVEDGTAGHAIYATSLHPCQVINYGTSERPDYKLVNISQIFTIRRVKFDNDTALQPQIATEGALLNFTQSTPLMVIPGKSHDHGVMVFDDLGLKVNTYFRVSINKGEKSVNFDPEFSTYVRNRIQLRGKPDHNATNTFIQLQTVSPRKNYIRLEVKLLDCPPGFILNKDLECICNAGAYVALLKCDSFQSYLLPGYWAGLIKTSSGPGSELATSPCIFCNYNERASNSSDILLPQSYFELSEAVCGKTRTGTGCGKCQENYTVYFHSPGFLCKPAEPAGCKLGWLFYTLSELLPVTIVFITVLVLNINFTTGTVNGFILFSQLLDSLDINASGIIVLPDSVRHRLEVWTQGYQVIYGFFNMEFFNSESLSFCLWKGASALDMLAFRYFTILYILLLIMAVIWIMNRCGGKCCGKCCRITTVRTSVIHGISTFLVVCYAQCVRISLTLLLPVDLYVREDSDFRPPARVWLNAELQYFSNEHLLYALPAIFCLLTIGLVPPALLLIYPLFNQLLAMFSLEDQKPFNLVFQKLPLAAPSPCLTRSRAASKIS